MKRILALCIVVGTATTLLVIALRGSVIGLFLKDLSVAKLAESILTLLMLSSPFLGFFYLSTNFLQATGKAALATVISTLQKGALLIPLLFILEYFQGFYGVIYAYVTADLLASIMASVVLILCWTKVKRKLSGGVSYKNTISYPSEDEMIKADSV